MIDKDEREKREEDNKTTFFISVNLYFKKNLFPFALEKIGPIHIKRKYMERYK